MLFSIKIKFEVIELTLSRFPHDEIKLIRRLISFLVNVESKAANIEADAIIDGR